MRNFRENANSQSQITTRIRPDGEGPQEVQILRNTEEGFIVRIDPRIAWDHLFQNDIPFIEKELLDSFSKRREELKPDIAFEPFQLTVSMWRKGEEGTIQAKKHEKVIPLHTEHFDDTAARLLAKLPKMVATMRRVHAKNTCDLLMIAFEWLETKDAKPASKVAEMVSKIIRDADKG